MKNIIIVTLCCQSETCNTQVIDGHERDICDTCKKPCRLTIMTEDKLCGNCGRCNIKSRCLEPMDCLNYY